MTSSPTVLWQANQAQREASNIYRYMQWLARNKGKAFASYDELWQWSVSDLEGFWGSVWEFCEVQASTPYTRVLPDRRQPGAQWFTDSRVNYAQQMLARHRGDACAIRYGHENGSIIDLSWNDMMQAAGALAGQFTRWGIRPGDRIAAVLPNTPSAVIALIACAAVGAVWSSCAPEMGESAVLDRFGQIAPRVLLVVDGYEYGGKRFDRREVMQGFVARLPSVEHVIVIPQLDPAKGAEGINGAITWSEALAVATPLAPIPLPFDHPLWIVYSSGTTGLPKGIVHGHGGIIVEHLKALTLHHEVSEGDAYCWLSSTGWIVWNMHVSSLLAGATMVIFDGRPDYPDNHTIWRFLERAGVTVFGGGAAFYTNMMKAGVSPKAVANLDALHALSSTGSPLPDEAYDWIYSHIKKDVWLAPVSGGTDFAGGFVGGCILLPVLRGEMQCRMLGCGVQAFDPKGEPLIDAVGELVCTTPLPSMPLYFWNDPEGKRLNNAYYDMYPGVWRHGDWIRITPRGGAIIYGRSDSTINRYGIRMGTAEIYRVVEDIEEISDSMVVDLEYLGRESYMPLFVVLRDALELDDRLKSKIIQRIRAALSARYLPNEIFSVPAIPRTLTGKKMEVPIKRLLLGESIDVIANPDAMSNPQSLAWYRDFAQQRRLSH